MKFFPKHTISTVNMKYILTLLVALSLCTAFIFAPFKILPAVKNTSLISFMLSSVAGSSQSKGPSNPAEKLLSLTLPNIAFSSPQASPVALNFTSPEVISAPPPAVENTALPITYESSPEKGYISTDGIYINNQTRKKVDIAALLNTTLDLSLPDTPTVLILHTHTTESYTPNEKYNYTPTETDRTTDAHFNMISVGEVIAQSLLKEGINVIHDKTINDYPSYSTSYSKSLKLIESYTKKYPSIKIVIDVHRDAIVNKSGQKMRPVTNFNPSCAQVMMVVGTNDSGLKHPSWQTNLTFCLKLQQKMNSLYPSLARPINLRKERFNHHLAPYSFILEVGTNGNTLDEAKEAASLFSESLISLLNE